MYCPFVLSRCESAHNHVTTILLSITIHHNELPSHICKFFLTFTFLLTNIYLQVIYAMTMTTMMTTTQGPDGGWQQQGWHKVSLYLISLYFTVLTWTTLQVIYTMMVENNQMRAMNAVYENEGRQWQQWLTTMVNNDNNGQ